MVGRRIARDLGSISILSLSSENKRKHVRRLPLPLACWGKDVIILMEPWQTLFPVLLSKINQARMELNTARWDRAILHVLLNQSLGTGIKSNCIGS